MDIVIDYEYDLLDPLAGYQTGGEEDQLLSLEKLRASPELWPEQSKLSFTVTHSLPSVTL